MSINLAIDLSRRRHVPNEFPTSQVSVPYRIAVVGEAPGSDEEEHGRPFIGKSGFRLDNLLSNAGILRATCFVGNICQIRPPQNIIEKFAWDGEEIQSGLEQLKKDLNEFKPNLCLLLGSTPLRSGLGAKKSITDWRGSLFTCENSDSPFFGLKCLPSFHPAYILRNESDQPLLIFDLKRARREGESPELHLPKRDIRIDLTAEQIIHRLVSWPSGQECSIDIEGVLKNWTCVSVASSPSDVFIIDWYSFSLEEEVRVMVAFSHLLWRHDVPKTLQNCLYDNFVMMFGYRILAHNITEDTMLKGWEIYPELPKTLGVQASIWTRQPNWKDDLMAYTKKKRDALQALGVAIRRNNLRGCCIDSAVTSEIQRAQQGALAARPVSEAEHYRFNLRLLRPLLYMEVQGINYDIPGSKEMLAITELELNESKTRLAAHTNNYDLFGKTGSFSTQKLAVYLYKVLGLPTQYKKEHGRNTDKVTTDTESLLQLIKKANHPVLHEVLFIKRRLKIRQYLRIETDPDGRVRCGYNIVGSETGRLACYESPTGSGTNLTTITKHLRRLYCADPDHDCAQFDLSGADGWTVALHCKRLGDDTMLEDYKYGIKPAQVIAIMYSIFQQEMAKLAKRTQTMQLEVMQRLQKYFREIPREELKKFCKQVDSNGWLYFGSKRVQHGKNYLLGKDTMSSQILKDSYKFLGDAILLAPNDCELLGNLYIKGRYNAVEKWQKWVADELVNKKYLIGASGHRRTFFGRIKERGEVCHTTLREAVADEPQENTTYAANLALEKLWLDPENRIEVNGRTHLIIKPLNHMHDALLVQWPKDRRAWAADKVKNQYFNNELTIADQKIVIAVEGAYGPNWSGHHFACPKQNDSKNPCTCGDDHGDI